MNASRLVWSVCTRLVVPSLAFLLAGGCGPPEGNGFSSTLQVPPKPGDGYELVRTKDEPHAISVIGVGGNSLFFGAPRQGVYEMPKYGGPIETVDRGTGVLGLVASADEVVWLKAAPDTPTQMVLRRPTNGGETAILRHGNLNTIGYDNENELVADASHVYTITQTAPLSATAIPETVIDVIPIAGGEAEHVALPPDQRGPYVTVAGDYPVVYFTACAGVIRQCALQKVDLSAGTSEVVAAASDFDAIVGLDEDAVYLLGDRGLWSIARADGSERVLVGAESGIFPSRPFGIDGQSLYFMGKDPGASVLPAERLMTIPKAGGSIAIIGSDSRINKFEPWGLAVDDQFVFVLTSTTTVDSGNEILAFPKTLPPAP